MSDTALNDIEKQTAVAAMVAALVTEYVKNQPLTVEQIPTVFATFKTEIERSGGSPRLPLRLRRSRRRRRSRSRRRRRSASQSSRRRSPASWTASPTRP